MFARWFGLRKNLGTRYNPFYFLAALGNGGMAVAFFIWLNFLIPHPKTPIVTFDSIAAFMAKASLVSQGLTLVAMAMIIFFAVRHLRSLVWNIREFGHYRKTSAFITLNETNASVGLMARPLTFAMTVNVLFVVGAIFVPGLWNIVEYLFPFSLTAFIAIGIFAIRTFLSFFGRAVATGFFDCTRNNHLGQLQSVMAFVMVGVGAAAPAAMSSVKLTVAVSIFTSIFFLSAAVLLAFIVVALGFRGMLEHGLAVEAAPSLWVLIPVLTLFGIAIIRINHGLHSAFEAHTEPYQNFIFTSIILGLQIFIGVFGYSVMNRVNYLRTYLWGEGRSPGSYALICPAVALFVFGMFFIHNGLVQNGLIEKYSLVHYASILPFAIVQVIGIVAMFRLDAKLIRPDTSANKAGEPAHDEVQTTSTDIATA
ncbi:hypothetical protein OSCT_3228 [Oscillochloris trichoides DG-6]|uniref:Uncharacterized protein n=1 Tax=Oscillochloris trichoides DG-6 TaxID=765420 RepID=E1IIS7_9CHLR|nr:hypothetical protein [Oscillochloris trichoides]EFO78933.1 hypothetical protein OSCT_3228 [Oscillochloris trichoides DG-6]